MPEHTSGPSVISPSERRPTRMWMLRTGCRVRLRDDPAIGDTETADVLSTIPTRNAARRSHARGRKVMRTTVASIDAGALILETR